MSKPQDVEVVSAKILNNSILRVLDQRHMSQLEFARRVGISYRHGNRIIANEGKPSLVLAIKIARVLGVPLLELFNIEVRTRKVRRQKEPVAA